MKNLLTDHPNSVGEGYFEHMGQAMSFSAPLFLAAIACLGHAFLPFLFEKTGSKVITNLHDRMVTNRVRHKNLHKVVPAPAE